MRAFKLRYAIECVARVFFRCTINHFNQSIAAFMFIYLFARFIRFTLIIQRTCQVNAGWCSLAHVYLFIFVCSIFGLQTRPSFSQNATVASGEILICVSTRRPERFKQKINNFYYYWKWPFVRSLIQQSACMSRSMQLSNFVVFQPNNM